MNELVWEPMNTLAQNSLYYNFLESFKTYINYITVFLAYFMNNPEMESQTLLFLS